MAKVSIIIPVYNTAKYLDECMESVTKQTMKDIEIILVDDGSTDGISPSMCDEYAKKDDRVIVVHKENGGLMSAWIEGTKHATSDYLMFLDSDDWIDLVMCEELYRLTDSSFADSEIISGNYIVEKAGERRKETQGLTPGVYKGDELDKVRQKLLGEEVRPVTMSRCMKLISRKLLLENIKYCNTKIKMSEDVNIMLPCLCDCKRLVITKDSYFYHYRLVAASIAHGYDPHLLDNLELTDSTYRGILKEKGISNGNKQLDREYVMILFLVLKNELRCEKNDTVKRIRNIFLNPEIKEKISNAAITVSSSSNRLLYFCMKHPSAPVIGITKLILSAYDKKTNT